MGLGKKTIDDENYAGKRVLVRCDFNVPMKDGVITNDNRINAALPTIKKLINDGAKVILCSHLGKPKNGPEAKFSLAPVAVRLSEKLGQPVVFADDDNVVGENAKAAVATMNNGDVVLLQNTRFRKEETKNLPEFSEELASLADAYVDDAFGSCHRAHCSTAGVTDYVKDTAVGYLMEKEIKYLGNAVNDPERPFTAILGGAKVADKLNVISNLLEKVDTLIIGGGMAYTFLKAQGYEIGKSLCDDSKLDYCKEMMAKAQEKGVKLLLPVDAACIKDFPDPIDAPIETVIVPVTAIPADMEGCDIGPETMKLFADAVKASKTVVWNGPMGVFENPTLAAGTLAVAKAMAESDATTVIGGGDSAAAVQQMGLGHHVLAVVELAVVAQALANLVALGLQEGVGHAAADDQRVDLLQQVGDDVQLVCNLGAAQNSGEGTLGIVHGVAEILDLLLHQVADSGILDIVGHTGGGAVSAVAGAEGVVNVSVGQAGLLLAESGLVLGLLLAETGVLQQNDLAVAHGGNSSLGVLADDIVIVRKGDRLAQLLAQADSNGGQAELGLGAVLRLAQMAAQDDLSAVGNQLLDGRQCGVDAVIVGDNAVLHRDVEVAANQYALAGVVLIVNGLFTQTHSKSSSRYVSHFWRGAPRPKGFILIIRIKPKLRKCF